jgi:hypothetical protein
VVPEAVDACGMDSRTSGSIEFRNHVSKHHGVNGCFYSRGQTKPAYFAAVGIPIWDMTVSLLT